MEATAPHTLPFPFWGQEEERDNDIDDQDDEGALVVEKIDICSKENGVSHRTDKYDLMNRTPAKLVVRRGQDFILRLVCNRSIKPKTDTIWLVLAVDPINNEWVSHGHGTVVYLLLKTNDNATEEREDESDWSARLETVRPTEDGDLMEHTITIRTSPYASVSKWTLSVNVKSGSATESAGYMLDQPIYLLFNPWCEEDPVFLENEEERSEYVLEDMTLIWKGTARSFYPSQWKVGQYEENILDCTLNVLGRAAGLTATYRGNAIRVCRALSGAVNSNDNYGVVIGNWSGKYKDGTAPSAWTGSVKILQQYYQSEDPVPYGQCWVFAGVLATMCRTLGIPCRIITNFTSGHDTEGSLTLDVYMDEEANPLPKFSRDSIWNYHVWNEVWLKRNDLGTSEYDGWQVIDGTPQEYSDLSYKLGPAPVKAVRDGLVNMLYDCAFVYAEVNADKVFWRYRGPSTSVQLIDKDTTGIGQFISTKAVGSNEREDVTQSYKFEEQSAEATVSMLRALKLNQCSLTKRYRKMVFGEKSGHIAHQGNDVEFELILEDQAMVGESFQVALRIRNVSGDEQTARGRIHLNHVLYTGKNIKTITSHPFTLTLDPESEQTIEVPISFDDYYEPGMNEAIFKVTSFATIDRADYEFFSQEDYRLRRPHLQLELACEPIYRSSVKMIASFTNPLPVPITEGILTVECSGLCRTLTIPVNAIDVGDKYEVTFLIMPSFQGSNQVTAKFQSNEISDIEGSLSFDVMPPEDRNSNREVLFFT
ncbi:glutamine gamma-glutamyltransferase [Anopheles darlingi]|uniref:protein-glutamine gamma-glutamyltransferase n=1 Tax=Anopheles darlingi TaxID=43151 RepID=W5JCY5_ANODA|nr:glutamine gamma-glutamyltransferase [Anopheles darlingi]